ncbi:MAG: DUF1570 domain-containing protein [bacterium]|nr:DUF1570 domain-containing protein [bacterium]
MLPQPVHRILGALLATSVMVVCSRVYAEPPRVLEVQLQNSAVHGMPIHWGERSAVLLDTAGAIHWLDMEQVVGHRLLPTVFAPQGLAVARSQLQSELGNSFETLVAGPYVIAAPVGQAARWQSRFLSVLSGYTRYFNLRGWSIKMPEFPLVIIVFPTRDQFVNYAVQHYGELPRQAVGSYFTQSNRCILYQQDGMHGTDWRETEATIVHEAIHQLSYNTQVQERLFAHPLWFSEGLATMFEQAAVYDLGVNRSQVGDRVHWQKLSIIRPLLKNPAQLANEIDSLIESDTLFERDAQKAYALSWAMTFFMAERMPQSYHLLIELQNQRGLGDYGAAERKRDFAAACEISTKVLASHLIGFYQDLGPQSK